MGRGIEGEERGEDGIWDMGEDGDSGARASC